MTTVFKALSDDTIRRVRRSAPFYALYLIPAFMASSRP